MQVEQETGAEVCGADHAGLGERLPERGNDRDRTPALRRKQLRAEVWAQQRVMLGLAESVVQEVPGEQKQEICAELRESARLMEDAPGQALALQLHAGLLASSQLADELFLGSLAVCPGNVGVVCCVLRPEAAAALHQGMRETGLSVSEVLNLGLYAGLGLEAAE